MSDQALNKWLAGIATGVMAFVGVAVWNLHGDLAGVKASIEAMQRDRVARIEADVLSIRSDLKAIREAVTDLRLRNAAWDVRWPDLATDLTSIQDQLDATAFSLPANVAAPPPVAASVAAEPIE